MLLEIFEKNLASKPYCTNELGHLLIRTRSQAIRMKYIQHNRPTDLQWMVYDVDSPSASTDWYDCNAPKPNIIALNPENGHGHYFYGLETPVHLQHGRRDNPFRYAAAIDAALTEKIHADYGYSKLISKNPRHDHWKIITPTDTLYDLDRLSEHLDLRATKDHRRKLPDIGLGRNCNLFDRVRRWAYSSVRQHWLGADFWAYQVENITRKWNDFLHPLPDSEVRSIAKSVSKWVWNHMSEQGFKEWGDRRREKSLLVRQDAMKEKLIALQRAIDLNPKATQQELSAITGIPQQSISRLIHIMKN